MIRPPLFIYMKEFALEPYDDVQWFYANKLQFPVEYFKYKDFVCKYKVHGIFWKKIIVHACCIEHILDMHKDKKIKSIKQIER